MKQAEFAELSREVMPVLDKLTEIAGQHGTAEKLVSITLSAEGYIHFTVHDSGMCLSRLKREDAPELEIRKQLSQEMGREEKEHEQSKKHDNRGRISAPERRLQESQENGSTAI